MARQRETLTQQQKHREAWMILHNNIPPHPHSPPSPSVAQLQTPLQDNTITDVLHAPRTCDGIEWAKDSGPTKYKQTNTRKRVKKKKISICSQHVTLQSSTPLDYVTIINFGHNGR